MLHTVFRESPNRRETVATQLITRGSLREEILNRLRSLVVEGDLPPGARINESSLSGELGVSRTPLREALLLLSGEGLVVCEPARGFLSAPLSVEQARDSFPILAALEALALRSAKGVAVHRLDQLRDLHAQYESAPTLESARAIDERWHRVLTSGCSNDALHLQLERHRAIERRAWLATAGAAGRWPQPSWVFQHAAVMEAIDSGETDAACDALERHWSSATRETLSSLARGD
jgi:DNA-binding GntR family transcriptional regulator